MRLARLLPRIWPLLLLAWAPAAASSEAGDAGFDLQEVAPGIHVHHGRHELPRAQNHLDIANIGFIVGERCVAVIDPGGSRYVARRLRAALRRVTDRPVCYVIDTHVHADHLLGNAVFREKGVTFIGHEGLPDALLSNEEFFTRQFIEPMGEGGGPDYFVVPDHLVKIGEPMRIDLGNRELVLQAWPKSHTGSDLTVYDPGTRTLWAADLLFMERIPPLEGSLKGWLAVLDELEKIPARQVVPGHGPVIAPWPAALAPERRYLSILLEETREAVAEGLSLQEALERVGYSERENWVLFDDVHGRNVTRAYTELEWE
ncbi:MAG: quinoprotein relay system zinc metallohydrolase 2 [Gammaproteobacteria bacterium]|nr:MAG: quinoprotein relay system zinc metallohydrolase 2 [Gammaproteobacteria bacterium]